MKLSRLAVVLSFTFCSSLNARDIALDGTLPQIIKINRASKQGLPGYEIVKKEIRLLKIKLSDKAKQKLARKMKKTLHSNYPAIANANLPQKVELGMNDLPVLNQGSHGSCVTFAATAAIDALIHKGDYISQLCQLQLGNFLQNHSYQMSGWNGTIGRTVLGQMENFGFVNKENEKANGCGGFTEYPLRGSAPDTAIDLDDFFPMSESLENYDIYWSPILDFYQALNRFDTSKTLEAVKAALAEGDRIIFATLLVDTDKGLAGAVGTKVTANDTWVLTPEIERDLYLRPDFAGHEMVITGYDDNAVAKDEAGREHRGLFTLRNSWGEDVGDRGTFYISYDYFKVLVVEATRISQFD